MTKRVLVVEDEANIMLSLVFVLEREGYEVRSATTGRDGLAEMQRQPPDLVILDLMLPGLGGLEICRELRASRQTAGIPILMLTAKAEETDQVVGFTMGANDYVTKPFDHRELVARIRAFLRRHGADADVAAAPVATPATVLQAGPVTMNLAQHTVTKDGRPVKLTVTEFRLLRHLLANAGTVVPTKVLLKEP